MSKRTPKPDPCAGKAAAMQHWAALKPNQPVLPHFEAIPNKAEGSKYGACGIRIDGTPEFVDAVLSRLKDLLAAEDADTRLELARRKVTPTEIGGKTKDFANAEHDAEVCYIRRHYRGNEARLYARAINGRG